MRDARSLRKLLELARATKAHLLAKALRGGEVLDRRAVQFRLEMAERAELNEALLAFGAEPRRRGLALKEQALLRMVRKAVSASGNDCEPS